MNPPAAEAARSPEKVSSEWVLDRQQPGSQAGV